jgi:hypothetical protein
MFTASIVVECLEEKVFDNEDSARRYILENIKVQTVLQNEEVLP